MENAVTGLTHLHRVALFTQEARERAPELQLPATPVRVIYRGTVHNAMRGVNEPVYACQHDLTGASFIGLYFASALHDFRCDANDITEAMLDFARHDDDLNAAIKGVMDEVGIDDGGIAGMVFSGVYDENWWRNASPADRLGKLYEWRDAEIAATQD